MSTLTHAEPSTSSTPRPFKERCTRFEQAQVILEDTLAVYGVFDGHGNSGHKVSEMVKNEIPKFHFFI